MTLDDILEVAEVVGDVVGGLMGRLLSLGARSARETVRTIEADKRRKLERILALKRVHMAAGAAAHEAASKAGPRR